MDSDIDRSSSDEGENSESEARETEETLEAAVEDEPIVEEEVLQEVNDERNLGLKFPLTRVKKIMKADPDLQLASQDAVFLITKATVNNSTVCSYFEMIGLTPSIDNKYQLFIVFCC